MKTVKRVLSILMAVIMIITIIPFTGFKLTVSAASFNDINQNSVFLKQAPNTSTCTLVAATNMIRRTSLLRGDSNWSSITESKAREVGWIYNVGLRGSFTYSNGIGSISVTSASLPGNSSNTNTLINILASHPEGIVIYNGTHAVLLTDYTGGVFYCNDPDDEQPVGRVEASRAYSVKPTNATTYWYVSSPSVSLDGSGGNDNQAPTYSNPFVSCVSDSSFNINVTLSDNVGIKDAWVVLYGPDGEHQFAISANSGFFYYTFYTSNYGGSGKYTIHLYVHDFAGNTTKIIYDNINTVADTTPEYINLGDDFYAYIIKKNSWKHLESSASGNVQIANGGNDSMDPKQIWHFLRQSDDSYKIVNEYKNTCLDADGSGTVNGTNVQTWENNNSSAQRWYLIQASGGYRLKSQNCNLYLDCLNDSDSAGTNVQLWETSLDTAQVFSIYNVTKDGQIYSKPAQPPKVTCSATVNPGDVTLSWTDSPARNDYDKRAYVLTVYDSSGMLVLSEGGLTETSYTFNPPGKDRYHFSVKAINTRYYDWWSASNTVYFDINKPVLTICYDCRNSDFDIGIDESKGFFLSDNKVICTTTEINKEIDGTPNVFYQTLYEGCSIGENGLFDFDDFGLTVPEGYEFSNYWKCRENNRQFSQSASFYTVLNFNPEYNGEPTVVHLTPADVSGVRLTVHFSGGLTTKTNRVHYMEKYGSLPKPISGREFKGWYTSSKGGSIVTEDTICTQTSSHTLYAHWVIPTFTVTLNNNGSYASGTEKVFYQYNEERDESYYFYTDEECTIPFDDAIVCPKRAGYVFKGYFTEENGGGIQYIDENGVCINELNKQAEDLTLYACWQTTAHIHSYDVSIVDATCTEPGKVVYSCACGNTINDIIPAIGHRYEEWSWSVIPTYQTDGLMERECFICHSKETKAVSKPIYNCCFKDEFVCGFNANLDISEFIANYTIENDVEFSVLPAYKNKIGTGTVIKLEYPEHHSLAYNVVIFGDVNGDGWYDGTDAIIVNCLANGMLTKDNVSEAVYMAADCNHDGVIDTADVLILQQAGVLLSDVDQSKSAEELLETSSAYAEYLNLIDQTVDVDDGSTDAVSDVITDEQINDKSNVFDWFISFIIKIVNYIKLHFSIVR